VYAVDARADVAGTVPDGRGPVTRDPRSEIAIRLAELHRKACPVCQAGGDRIRR